MEVASELNTELVVEREAVGAANERELWFVVFHVGVEVVPLPWGEVGEVCGDDEMGWCWLDGC